MALPVARDTSRWSGHRLVERMVLRTRQTWTCEGFFGAVVPEPVLAGLKAPDDRMPCLFGVFGGVLAGRAVATPDMAASSAAPQVKPPAIGGQAFKAAGTTWGHRGIDLLVSHSNQLSPITSLVWFCGLLLIRPVEFVWTAPPIRCCFKFSHARRCAA
jgi:hypothetical protein